MKYYPEYGVLNYRPDLIIHIGSSIFYHRELFMIEEAYPRILPFYSTNNWKTPPNLVKNESLSKGLKNIKNLRSLLEIYYQIKQKSSTDGNVNKNILTEIDRIIPFEVLPKTLDNLNQFFDDINLEILSKKFTYYFQ